MKIKTHEKIDRKFCGTPLEIKDGYAKVIMKTSQEMTADSTGLVHGGFVFGLADYAAMLAVNHPFVVLGSAEIQFLKPVRTGDMITAEAQIVELKGRKSIVAVKVYLDSIVVFEGKFTCFSLEKHVLDK